MDEAAVAKFFVDEAGDLALFSKRGTPLLGREGVSRTFMLGVLCLEDVDAAYGILEQLRSELMSDRYFRGVPSMQPEARKTAVCFHAKDDLPEVRREVFKALASIDAKAHVAIRRKDSLIRQARNHFRSHHQKLSDNVIYDALVKTLFKNLLHKADQNHVTFARRGKRARQAALENALTTAQRGFEKRWKKGVTKPVTVATAVPSDSIGLQIVDYYLWAVQRLFERGEDRFFELLADRYSLVLDLDDRRENRSGCWYSRRKPLELTKIKPVAG